MAPEGLAGHLPSQVPIEGYGNGGFRFAGMSHRGSLLCLPSGIWAWPVDRPEDINAQTLARLFAESASIEWLILGTGTVAQQLPEPLKQALRDHQIAAEVMTTGAAVRTYNVVVGEGRRAAAALIAVGKSSQQPPPAQREWGKQG